MDLHSGSPSVNVLNLLPNRDLEIHMIYIHVTAQSTHWGKQ